MKTPEEIKLGLECCINSADLYNGCNLCPYNEEKFACFEVQVDALAYIRQLEREKEALIGMVRESRYVCDYCKRYVGGCTKPASEIYIDGRCFEWRGVEDENGKD